MTKSKLFIVTGISGSGKTTVARHLIERGEVAFDSKITPDLYQFVDADGNVAPSVQLNNEKWQATYKWTLNETKLDALLANHSNTKRVFLCGRANLFQYWHKADKVFLLKVDETTLRERLNNESRDNLFAKDKPTQDKLLSALELVQDKIASRGAVVIDANKTIDSVMDEILANTRSEPIFH